MDLYQILYIAIALLGTLIYNYAGYLKFGKPAGEPFDLSKVLTTVIKGGGLSSILTYIASVYIPGSGISIFLLINAFVMGVSFPAGLDKLGDVISPDLPAAVNTTNVIVRLEALEKTAKTAWTPQTPPAASPTAQTTAAGPPATS